MRAIKLLLSTGLTACAPAGPAPPRNDGVVRVGLNQRTAILETGQELPRVYDSLAIPRNTLDHASKSIGNTGFLTRRTLGKVRLSEYIDSWRLMIARPSG